MNVSERVSRSLPNIQDILASKPCNPFHQVGIGVLFLRLHQHDIDLWRWWDSNPRPIKKQFNAAYHMLSTDHFVDVNEMVCTVKAHQVGRTPPLSFTN